MEPIPAAINCYIDFPLGVCDCDERCDKCGRPKKRAPNFRPTWVWHEPTPMVQFS